MRSTRLVPLAIALIVVACRPGSKTPPPRLESPPATRWLVIAPHPDDEVLIAAGVLRSAVERGDQIAVAVMTNGDYDCVHDGLARERETIAGLATLGVPDSRVFFLGYPDGGLAKLGRAPLKARRFIGGACVEGSTTYGGNGAGGADYHRTRFGAAADYTRENAVADLAKLIDELAPTDVAITHPDDTHPDHATTYVLFRAALDRLSRAPRVHRALVHNDDCWPIGTAPHEPCPKPRTSPAMPTPPLTNRLAGYEPRERMPLPPICFDVDRAATCKLRAIAAHASQTRSSPDSYLFGFARSDEAFFPETFTQGRRGWYRPAPVADAAVYALSVDASRSTATLRKGSTDLRIWPLSHDAFLRESRFELAAHSLPEDGDVVEIELRSDGELVAVAVDVSASPSVHPGP